MTYELAIRRATQREYEAFANYRVVLRESRSGPWQIKRFNSRLDRNYLAHVRGGRCPGVGEFTGLIHDKRDIVMSDIIPEILDVRPYLPFLCGHVLITGLGIAMVPHILLRAFPHQIESITVIERDPHVIRLVGPQCEDIRIICASAFSWKPDREFDCAWHDIWDRIRPVNKPDFARLRRHYKDIPAMRQFCWSEAPMLRSNWLMHVHRH